MVKADMTEYHYSKNINKIRNNVHNFEYKCFFSIVKVCLLYRGQVVLNSKEGEWEKAINLRQSGEISLEWEGKDSWVNVSLLIS